jgi:hypothetical protein
MQAKANGAANGTRWHVVLAAMVGLAVTAGEAGAQSAPGSVDAQRNCQTLRTCQFNKGGSFRGCISTYSCRSCKFVQAKCSVGTITGNCRRQVCSWGA